MIGLVGSDERADRVAEVLREGGFEIAVAPADELEPVDPEVAVTVGESALIDVVSARVDLPVCAVAVDGLPSVSVADVPTTIEAFLAGDVPTRLQPLLSVRFEGETIARAVFDAMLVRSEPGRISEYSLTADEARSRFRADGVVAATPAGSHGYARAAGGPRLGRHTDSVVVVPVAAFGLGAPTWVLDPAPGIELRVERDEGDVSLLVDGRARRTFSGETSVSLGPGGTLETIGSEPGEGGPAGQ